MDFVARPLVQPFAEFISMPCLLDNLRDNYRYWFDRDTEDHHSADSP